MNSLFASLAPIGILLGPMALPFVWFSERIDPAVTSTPPGAAIHVVALVQSDWPRAIQLEIPETIALDETTPASRTATPIHQTLELLLTLLQQPTKDGNQPWELQAISSAMRQQGAEDLKAYLAAGIPPQGITWVLRPQPDFTGKFAVSLNSKGAPPLVADVVIGDENPPTPTLAFGPKGSPFVQLQIVYPKPKVAQAFWQPFAHFADPASLSQAGSSINRLAGFNVSWLWLYLLVYLPVLFLARRLLFVA